MSLHRLKLFQGPSGPELKGDDGDVLRYVAADEAWEAKPAGGVGAVSSVYTRTGAVIALLGDYAASLVSNDSGVVGATVKAALDALQTRIAALVASEIGNDSNVPGATVKIALNNLIATAFDANDVNVDQAFTAGFNVYTDLATVGPTVTIETGARALVMMSAVAYHNLFGFNAFMAVDLSGATVIPATDQSGINLASPGANFNVPLVRSFIYDGLTPGVNIFQLKYKINGDGGAPWHYADRSLAVFPFPF